MPDATLSQTTTERSSAATRVSIVPAFDRASDVSMRAVLDALPVVAVMTRPDGAVSHVTPRWTALTGLPAEAVLERAYALLIHEDDRVRALEEWAAVASGETYRSEYRLLLPEGPRWVEAVAAPYRAPDGTVLGRLMTIVDVDQRKRAELELREQIAFNERLLASSEDCIKTLDLDGRLLTLNEPGARQLEIADVSRVLGSSWAALWPDAYRAVAAAAVYAGRNGETAHFTAEFATVAGTHRWWDVTLTPIFDGDGRPVRLLVVSRDVTEQRKIEEARRIAIAQLRFLVEAGRVLASSLEVTTTLENVARLAVGTIADACIFDVADDASETELVAVAHADRISEAVMRQMDRSTDAEPGRPVHPVRFVLATGKAIFVPQVDELWIGASAASASHADLMRRLEYRSLIVVPVVHGRRALGSLTLVQTGAAARRFEATDLAFAEEFGRRAGTALANARSFTRERTVATTLQAAALPRSLPRTAAYRFDAVYEAGGAEATIGGDWFDVVALRDGRVVVSVGDVLGSGLHAAVTMTKLRLAMQGAALSSGDPCAMLDVANEAMRLHDPDGLATAVAGVLDAHGGSLTFASAGHPAPVLRHADGRTEDVEHPGLMLGFADATRTARTVPLPPESLVVFYTDGLTEATRDIEIGRRRLHAALRDLDPQTADPARAIFRAVLPEGASDDVAILVTHVRPASVPPSDGR